MLAVCLAVASPAGASTKSLRPLAVGPSVAVTNGPSLLAADGSRYLVWSTSGGSIERWDTKANTRLVKTPSALGLPDGCLIRDLRHAKVLLDCGTLGPRLISVRRLVPVPVASAADSAGKALLDSTRDWERVGAQWIAGDRFSCDRPTGSGCPPVYLNWHTGQVRSPSPWRTRTLDHSTLLAAKACGALIEGRCIPDGLYALRINDAQPHLTLARPHQRTVVAGSYTGNVFLANGTVAWMRGKYAYVRGAGRRSVARFELPAVAATDEWHTVVATRQRLVVSAMDPGTSSPIPPVRYFAARIPAAVWG